jgi:hypothetical protein
MSRGKPAIIAMMSLVSVITTSPADASENEKCLAALPQVVTFKDPESVRVNALGYVTTEVVPVYGGSVIGRRIDLEVNAKNSFGGYVGPKIYRCYVSVDGERVLKIIPPAAD